jgi:FkbM family methyltransferase
MSAWKARARRVVMALAPPPARLPAEFHLQRRIGKLDPTLARIALGRRLPGRAIDAGANTGAYTYAFSRVFDRVEAFEPQPACAKIVEQYARGCDRVRVHRFGLSDRAGHATLHVPVVASRFGTHLASGLASLAPPEGFRSRTFAIDLVPLDAFGFDDVAALKIDVEGHEHAVLAGARETIARTKPLLIVEIEQRHLPPGVAMADLFGDLADRGYRGWFFRDGAVEPVGSFRVERDQLPFVATIERGEAAPGYINNFVFEPVASAAPNLFALA